jgi:hypothetical protein
MENSLKAIVELAAVFPFLEAAGDTPPVIAQRYSLMKRL